MIRFCGLVIMRKKSYENLWEANNHKINELNIKVGSLKFENRKLQDMLRMREEYIDNLLEDKIPLYE